MYRGFISEVGRVIESSAVSLRVHAPKACAGLEPGGSVSVAGVCVSAVDLHGDVFRAVLSTETERRPPPAGLAPRAGVNVELPGGVGGPIQGRPLPGHSQADPERAAI